MDVILRPVFNRPEMLELSLEYEAIAREYYGKTAGLTTLFVVEHGTPPKVLEIIDRYPYNKHLEFRPQRFGLTVSILEGMKQAFQVAENFIIYIEDDVLIHETYFQYMQALFTMDTGRVSVYSPYNFNDDGNVNEVRKGHHYAALAPVITKAFFDRYINKCAHENYYKNRHHFVLALNEEYKEHQGPDGYKYTNAAHNQQAGLINRLVDIAMIQDDAHVIMPSVNRQQHIGFFGHNRPGGKIPGDTYEDRLANLRSIITDDRKMYDLSATKQYDDYQVFSPKLDAWDGTLGLK